MAELAGESYRKAAFVRRLLVFGAVALSTLAGTAALYQFLALGGITGLEIALVLLFAINFTWIAGPSGPRHRRLRDSARRTRPRSPLRTTSKAARCRGARRSSSARLQRGLDHVAAGIDATLDLAPEGARAGEFDFFILVGHARAATIAAQEETGWKKLVKRHNARGRDLLPASPRTTLGRKAGNVADFVQHLGRRLRLHGRARCRQRDVRQGRWSRSRVSWMRNPHVGIVPDAADAARPRHAVRAGCSSSPRA